MRAPNDLPQDRAGEEQRRGGEGRPAGAVPRDLHRVWLQFIDQRWSSLAVIPSEQTPLARGVADAGAEVARIFALPEIHLIDAQGAELKDANRLVAEMTAKTASGGRVVIALDPPPVNSVTLPLLLRAEAVVLLVRLGVTDRSFVKGILDIVRRERVVGCLTYR